MDNNKALQYYTALKLHFTSPKYDFFKYKGQVAYKLDFDKRKDKWQLSKIAKHPDPLGLMVANLSVDPTAWSGTIISDVGMKRYKSWLKRNESLSYTFQQDIAQFLPDLEANWKVPKYEHPYLLKLYWGERISIETLVIMIQMFSLSGYWHIHLKDDIAWKSIEHALLKYQPFVRFDHIQYQKLFREAWQNHK